MLPRGGPETQRNGCKSSFTSLRPGYLLPALLRGNPISSRRANIKLTWQSLSSLLNLHWGEKKGRGLEVIPTSEWFSSASRSEKTACWSTPRCPSPQRCTPSTHPGHLVGKVGQQLRTQSLGFPTRRAVGRGGRSWKMWSSKKHGLLASPRFWHVLCVTGDSQSMGPWRSTNSMAANPMRKSQPSTSL